MLNVKKVYYKVKLTNDEKLRMLSDEAYKYSENYGPLKTDPINEWMDVIAEFEKAIMEQCNWQGDSGDKGLINRAKSMMLNLIDKVGKLNSGFADGYFPYYL